jgi:uncharacterized protein (TIGR03437 family)
VVIFATGEGQTSPLGVDGQLANSVPLPAPVLRVSPAVNNVPADVLYAGAAPTLVAGLLQVNLRIPPGVPSGNLPVALQIGNGVSQAGVTVAVQ